MISMMRNLEDLSLELMLNDIDDEEFGGFEFGGGLEFGGELEYVEGEIELAASGGDLDGGIVRVDDKGEIEESLRISLLKEIIY